MEALEVNMGFKGANKQALRKVLRGERVHGLSKEDMQKIVDANEKLAKELKDAKD
ncbi:MAG: hypothetical protein KDE33_29730 [Bacteroidetes bacterium]|nr:hypothetical protein [Bacteroidota bacterium]